MSITQLIGAMSTETNIEKRDIGRTTFETFQVDDTSAEELAGDDPLDVDPNGLDW